jgi:hypothetical protein
MSQLINVSSTTTLWVAANIFIINNYFEASTISDNIIVDDTNVVANSHY